MFPLDVPQPPPLKESTSEGSSFVFWFRFCFFVFFFSIYVTPRNRFQQHRLSVEAFRWKALRRRGNFILSIFLPNVGAAYQRRWGREGPSVVFLRSAWRPWRWQSSAESASQRAGFYRLLSKIFMSPASAELKRRIFCAVIRERRASLSQLFPAAERRDPVFRRLSCLMSRYFNRKRHLWENET